MPAPMDERGAASVPGFARSPSGGGATKVPRQTSAPSKQTIRAAHPSSVAPHGAPSPLQASVVLVVEVVGAVLVVEGASFVLVVVVVVVEPLAQKMSPFSWSAAARACSARSACCAAPRH